VHGTLVSVGAICDNLLPSKHLAALAIFSLARRVIIKPRYTTLTPSITTVSIGFYRFLPLTLDIIDICYYYRVLKYRITRLI